MNLYVFIYYLKKIENLNVYMLYKIHYFTLTVLFIAQRDALRNSSNTPLLSYIPTQMFEHLFLYIGIIAVLIGVSPIVYLVIQCPMLIFLPISTTCILAYLLGDSDVDWDYSIWGASVRWFFFFPWLSVYSLSRITTEIKSTTWGRITRKNKLF